MRRRRLSSSIDIDLNKTHLSILSTTLILSHCDLGAVGRFLVFILRLTVYPSWYAVVFGSVLFTISFLLW